MLFANYLRSGLDEHILRASEHYNGCPYPLGILFADEHTPCLKDHVCITSGTEAARMVASGALPSECQLFIPSGEADAVPEELFSLPDVSVYVTDLPYAALYNRLWELIAAYGDNQQRAEAETLHFENFLHNVVTESLLRATDIYEQYRRYPNTNNAPYRVIVTELEQGFDSATARSTIAAQIRELFPYCNSASYFDGLVTIQQNPESASSPLQLDDVKIAALEKICHQTHAFCCMSSQTKNWVMLRTQYTLARSILPIARLMRKDENQRVFSVEPYYYYLTIDYSYREFERIHGHHNYIYMLHPGVGRLVRYDALNHAHLRRLVGIFLLNNCNYSKTAAEANMHRNTVIYKLQKAKEILEDDLEDPLVRQRILWSCMLCDYCEKVLDIAPTAFPGYLK